MVKGKVVQTWLVGKEYELLRKIVRRKGLTIKQGLREAVQQWIKAQIEIAEDPLFNIAPLKTGVKTDSSRLDRFLYGERLK